MNNLYQQPDNNLERNHQPYQTDYQVPLNHSMESIQQAQEIPLLQQIQVGNVIDVETYFQQYQSLISQFKANIDCRMIPSKKYGDTFTLTKAGAEKICHFFKLDYQLFAMPSTKLDFVNNIFYYAHECKLSYQGIMVGNGFGNCNNFETKYKKTYSPDILNTLDKMSQKRAFISSVLLTTGGSRFFGQKMSDLSNY